MGELYLSKAVDLKKKKRPEPPPQPLCLHPTYFEVPPAFLGSFPPAHKQPHRVPPSPYPPPPWPLLRAAADADTQAEGVIHAWYWPGLAPRRPHSSDPGLGSHCPTSGLFPYNVSVPRRPPVLRAGRSFLGLPCSSLEGPKPAGSRCHRQTSLEPPEPLRSPTPTFPPQGT